MTIKAITLGLTTVGLLALGSVASAATFSFAGAGTTHTLNFLGTTGVTGDNDLGLGLGETTIDVINGLDKTASNGLSIVDGPSKVTFTYLGFEAGNSNFSTFAGGSLFTNGITAVGTSTLFEPVGDGLVEFSFGTSAPALSIAEIFNNAGASVASDDYAIGYLKISDTSYYVFFDDIAQGDGDFDDIGIRIDIAPVPVPAGILLMGTALAGFGAMRRRQNKKAA